MTAIAVDWTRCDGHGLCARLLPEKIGLDEWGYPLVLDPEIEPHLVGAARRAAAACPALALRVR
ncbi:MAG: ferredoxin [Aeromicrobium sp.]|uniref:ferredoxin n=1 Tax=Aeromicrobium sp. TaxID=1871063 RepID=UPI0025BBBDDF|nr:ferredoxin [Aeromicrobium sp.]MCK5891621.1 ferredoxin [Aeromicrobium sp.]MDF1704861.1 ferredoxin [Aeromicrobium sp.]